MAPFIRFHRRLMEKLWCCYGVTWLWNTWAWNWDPRWSCVITSKGWNKAKCKRSKVGLPLPDPQAINPERACVGTRDSSDTQELQATLWRKCAMHCWHITSSPHHWTSCLADAIRLSKIPKEKIPCSVYISTCAHMDTFFYGDENFWSWFWIPKDGECFFLYNVFIVEFPVI